MRREGRQQSKQLSCWPWCQTLTVVGLRTSRAESSFQLPLTDHVPVNSPWSPRALVAFKCHRFLLAVYCCWSSSWITGDCGELSSWQKIWFVPVAGTVFGGCGVRVLLVPFYSSSVFFEVANVRLVSSLLFHSVNRFFRKVLGEQLCSFCFLGICVY